MAASTAGLRQEMKASTAALRHEMAAAIEGKRGSTLPMKVVRGKDSLDLVMNLR